MPFGRSSLLLLLLLAVAKSENFIHSECRIRDERRIEMETDDDLDILLSRQENDSIRVEVNQDHQAQAIGTLEFTCPDNKWVEMSLVLRKEFNLSVTGCGSESSPIVNTTKPITDDLPVKVTVLKADDFVTNCPQGLPYKKLEMSSRYPLLFPSVGEEEKNEEIYLLLPAIETTIRFAIGKKNEIGRRRPRVLCWDATNNKLVVKRHYLNCLGIPGLRYHWLRFNFTEGFNDTKGTVQVLNKHNEILEELPYETGDRVLFLTEGLEGNVYVVQCLRKDRCDSMDLDAGTTLSADSNATTEESAITTERIYVKTKEVSNTDSSNIKEKISPQKLICKPEPSLIAWRGENVLLFLIMLVLGAILMILVFRERKKATRKYRPVCNRR